MMKKKIRLTIGLTFFIVGLFLFTQKVKAESIWVNNPQYCPRVHLGQSCYEKDNPYRLTCGYNSNTQQCYTTTYIYPNPPLVNSDLSKFKVSSSLSHEVNHDTGYKVSLSHDGGYMIDCLAHDGTLPYCDNGGDWWCARNSNCYNNKNRYTICLAGKRAGESGATSCGSCLPDYHNCDTSNSDCEIHDGDPCTIYGLPGVYDGCSGNQGRCVMLKQEFITDTNTKYMTPSGEYLLWGTEYGDGDLMKLSKNGDPDSSFVIENDGSVGIGTSSPDDEFIVDIRGDTIIGNQNATLPSWLEQDNAVFHINNQFTTDPGRRLGSLTWIEMNLSADTANKHYGTLSGLKTISDVNYFNWLFGGAGRIEHNGGGYLAVASGQSGWFSTTGEGDVGYAFGMSGEAFHRGTGEIGTMVGVRGYVDIESTGEIRDAAVGLDADLAGPDHHYSADVREEIGVRVWPSSPGGVGQVTNQTGIYVGSVEAGTNNNFAIHTEVGQVLFRDHLVVGYPADPAGGYAAGDINAEQYYTNGADIAESYIAVGKVEAGDLVSANTSINNSVSRTTKTYDKKALGIVSSNPGMWLSSHQRNSKPVALSGRVPAKVSNINGDIKRGDIITTSSLSGYGMKADSPGMVVGKALQDFIGGQACDTQPSYQCGTITVFVKVGWYEPDSFTHDLQALVEDYKLGNIDFGGEISRLVIDDSITTASIKADSAEFSTLTVDTSLSVADFIEAGGIRARKGEDLLVELSDDEGETAFRIKNSSDEEVFSIDSTGKLEGKGVFESEWIEIGGDSFISLDHNLDSIPRDVTVLMSQNENGKNATNRGLGESGGYYFRSLTNESIEVVNDMNKKVYVKVFLRK